VLTRPGRRGSAEELRDRRVGRLRGRVALRLSVTLLRIALRLGGLPLTAEARRGGLVPPLLLPLALLMRVALLLRVTLLTLPLLLLLGVALRLTLPLLRVPLLRVPLLRVALLRVALLRLLAPALLSLRLTGPTTLRVVPTSPAAASLVRHPPIIASRRVGERGVSQASNRLSLEGDLPAPRRKLGAALMGRFMLRLLALIVVLGVLPACAPTNVRAIRAYAYEDPDFVVALDRLDDIAETLHMLDVVLTEIPYSPGDRWIDDLALTDERAEELTAMIRQRPPYDEEEFTVPVVRLYRFHLADVIREASKIERDREEEADYPSLLAAMKDLTGGNDLADQWTSYQQAVAELRQVQQRYDEVVSQYTVQQLASPSPPNDLAEAADDKKGAEAKVQVALQRLSNSVAALKNVTLERSQRKAIASDALAAFSVVLRIDLEALALMPFAIANMVRSVGDAPASLLTSLKKRRSFESLEQLRDLPRMAETIGHDLERQMSLAEGITDALTEVTATELAETAGWQLQESAVDQIVGIALDSFHVNLNVDAEMFIFSQIGGGESRRETQDSEGNTSIKDLTGRTRRLEYQVAPIYMLGVRLNAGFDWIKLPNAATLKAGFSTDRVFSRGGTIESGSLGDQLGLKGVASDIFDFGLGVLGVDTNVKIATFNFGTVRELAVDPATGDTTGEVPGREADFALKYTQIDVGYDMTFLVSEWARKWYVEELWLGYRYFDYRLPRVLYELEGPQDNLSFVRQSPTQFMTNRYHMGGVKLRMGPSGSPFFHPYGDLGFFFGWGPTSYYFCDNDDTPQADEDSYCGNPSNDGARQLFGGSAGAINLTFALGARFRLTPKTWPFRAHAGIQYSGQLIGGFISQKQPGADDNRSIDLGSSELFHGPSLLLRGEL